MIEVVAAAIIKDNKILITQSPKRTGFAIVYFIGDILVILNFYSQRYYYYEDDIITKEKFKK